MRILLAPLVLGLLLTGCVAREPAPLDDPAPGNDAQQRNETWYLDAGESTDHALEQDMPSSSISSYPLFLPPGEKRWWPGNFTASLPSQGFETGSCLMLVAWIGENAPSDGTLTIEVAADGQVVATGAAPYSWFGGPFPPFLDMLEVGLELDPAQEIPEGSKLSLRLGFDDPVGVRIGFGSDWPSRLELREGPCAL